MPSPSSSRGGFSRGAPERGPSRGRGGGATNMTAYAVAAVLLILIVVVVMVLGHKPDKLATPPPAPTPPPAATPATPAGPAAKPYPPIAESTLQKGRDLVRTFEQDASRAQDLYKESLKAKAAGDDAAWQSKLKEARTLAEGIKDQWNEFIASLPHSQDYDEEEVAKHYFYKESGRVAQLTQKLLAAMKSDER